MISRGRWSAISLWREHVAAAAATRSQPRFISFSSAASAAAPAAAASAAASAPEGMAPPPAATASEAAVCQAAVWWESHARKTGRRDMCTVTPSAPSCARTAAIASSICSASASSDAVERRVAWSNGCTHFHSAAAASAAAAGSHCCSCVENSCSVLSSRWTARSTVHSQRGAVSSACGATAIDRWNRLRIARPTESRIASPTAFFPSIVSSAARHASNPPPLLVVHSASSSAADRIAASPKSRAASAPSGAK